MRSCFSGFSKPLSRISHTLPHPSRDESAQRRDEERARRTPGPEKPGDAKYQLNLIAGKDNTILLSKTTPEALITTSTGKRCRVHFAWPGEPSIQTYQPDKLENPAIQASTTAESPTLVSVLVPLPDGINATIKVSDDGHGGQIVRIAWSDGVKAEVKPADVVKPGSAGAN